MATYDSCVLSYSYTYLYFTRVNNYAKCNFCDANYYLKKNYSSIKYHIRSDHKDIYNSIKSKVSNIKSKAKKQKFEWPFSITEDNRADCDICHMHYDISYTVSTNMTEHLKKFHNIDENTAKEYRDWILYSNHVILNESSNTMTCKYCNQVFQNNNYFNFILMKHLIDAHQINVPFEIRSTSLLKNSSNLSNKGVENIVTSSSYRQSIFNDNSDIDVCKVSDDSDIDVCKISDNSDIDICN